MWLLGTFLAVLSSISTVRTTYIDAIEKSSKADELVKLTAAHNNNAVYRAYYGTGLALQAKHSWNPASKLSKASDASAELNAAVALEANNLEIRFLRFSFESNAPAFLGLSTHTSEDKVWILNNQNKQHAMWPTIRTFLKHCELLSSAEKQKII